MTTTEPLTDAYLLKCEQLARRFQGAWFGTSGDLAARLLTCVKEIRRLKAPPPAPTTPPLVEAINRQTMALLKNKTPTLHRALYISQDPYGKRFDRDPFLWIGGTRNLTCISPAQLSGTPWHLRAGTLITRRHVVYANHFGIPIIEGGTPILWVQQGGTVVERRVIRQVADADSDIAIGLLDAEVPEGISVAPVLPADYERHIGSRNAILAVTLDADEKASVRVCDTFHNGNFSCSSLDANWMPPEFKSIAAWGEEIVAGDSGNPVFLAVNGELVLLGCWRTAIGGPHLGARHELVGRMLEQLSPGEGYRLTTVKL